MLEFNPDFRFPAPEKHQCQHEGCTSQVGIRCELMDEDSAAHDQVFYYCTEHCHEEGFCYGCGCYWAGAESFEFGGGLCEECQYQMEDQEQDAWEPEEEDDLDDDGEFIDDDLETI